MKFDHACRGLMGINRDNKPLVGKFEFSISRNFPQLPIQKKTSKSIENIPKINKISINHKINKRKFSTAPTHSQPREKSSPKIVPGKSHTKKNRDWKSRVFHFESIFRGKTRKKEKS
jgi:hypothetical protein